MKWKRFLDLEVIEFFGTVSPRQRERFVRLFQRIREFLQISRSFTRLTKRDGNTAG